MYMDWSTPRMYHSDGKGQDFKQKGWLSQMSTPLLSIGMIVKDEIRCIERCFKSLEGLRKDLPCELVVADTGSTDGTREIVEKYADIVFDFEWCNDFAAARNAVLDRCTGKWHLQIDADEWLSDNYKELILFCHSQQFKTYHTAGIRIVNHYSENLSESISEFTTERLFRISSGFRFQGKVHEAARPPEHFSKTYQTTVLPEVFLHHDGYLPEVVKDRQKYKRNMQLLEPILEQHPSSMRVLCQCVESNEDTTVRLSYAEKGVEYLRKGEGEDLFFAPSLLRHAIISYAYLGKNEQMEETWQFAQEKYADSIYIKMDSTAVMLMAYYGKQEYEKAVKIGDIWYKNRKQYDANPYSHLSHMLGPLTTNSNYNTCAVYFEALCKMERWESAEEALYDINLPAVCAQNLISFINTFIDNAVNLQNPLKALKWVAEEQKERFKENKNGVDCHQYNSMLLAKMEEHFRKDGELSPVIAQMENDVGYSAKALLQQDDYEMIKCAECIQDWGNVMSLLYERILEKHLLFPPKFYQQNSEVWGSVASALPILPELCAKFLSYAENVPALTVEQQSWYSNLASALLTAKKWDSQTQAVALCRCFAQVDQELVAQMYLPQILTDTSIHLIPIGHRFSWYLKQAFEAIQTGKLKESIAILRKALESAPVYNAAIDALLDYISTLNSSPELLALAEKIRGILSQYSPDDPAVQAIKESAAYQKVAYLIDGVNPPVVGGLLQ